MELKIWLQFTAQCNTPTALQAGQDLIYEAKKPYILAVNNKKRNYQKFECY